IDVISFIGQLYYDMYNKHTTPHIAMPIQEGTTSLQGEITRQNRGLYESVTDVRTKGVSDLLGETFYVKRTATYKYDEYYLLENEDVVELGWMYSGDVMSSEYVPEEPTDRKSVV